MIIILISLAIFNTACVITMFLLIRQIKQRSYQRGDLAYLGDAIIELDKREEIHYSRLKDDMMRLTRFREVK